IDPTDVGRLIAWDATVIATAARADDGGAPERNAWSTRALSRAIPRDLLFQIALTLGADRPDNPTLLRQSTARVLRTDTGNGKEVSVFGGPRPAGETDDNASRTRYWLEPDGTFQRFEAYLGDANGQFATVTRLPAPPDVARLADGVAEVLGVAAAK